MGNTAPGHGTVGIRFPNRDSVKTDAPFGSRDERVPDPEPFPYKHEPRRLNWGTVGMAGWAALIVWAAWWLL